MGQTATADQWLFWKTVTRSEVDSLSQGAVAEVELHQYLSKKERHPKKTHPIPSCRSISNQFPQAHLSSDDPPGHINLRWFILKWNDRNFVASGQFARELEQVHAGNSEILWTSFKAHVNPFKWSWLPNYWLVLSTELGNGMIVNILYIYTCIFKHVLFFCFFGETISLFWGSTTFFWLRVFFGFSSFWPSRLYFFGLL